MKSDKLIRVRPDTHHKLRMLAAERKKTLVDLMDDLVDLADTSLNTLSLRQKEEADNEE